MDEKTEELRDIFMDVSDDGTVTEQQEAERGTLTEDEQRVNERLESVIARMREEYEFSTDLNDDALCRIVRGYFDDESDTALADELAISRYDVFRARLDLHLLHDHDTSFDLDELRDLLDENRSVTEIADILDVAEPTVRRYRHIIKTENEMYRIGELFKTEFEATLTDADFSTHMIEVVKEDGLEDATEGMETDISL